VDCRIQAAGAGDCLTGAIYSIELMGGHVLVTSQIDGQPIVVKAEQAFDGAFGSAAGVRVPAGRCYLFDRESGDRLRG